MGYHFYDIAVPAGRGIRSFTMWKDIIGHESQIEELSAGIRSGRIPHALLFAGPRGLGKTKLAREYFKGLNCLTSKGDPCDTCRSCIKAEAGTHPDLHFIGPSNGWILVEDIRKIITETGLNPYEARTRVIVIEPAEKLNKASSNALLKTLEEPPAGTIILLVSHKPSLLLPTILSRCQVFRFTPLDPRGSAKGPVDPFILRLTSGTLGGMPEGDLDRVMEIRSGILGMLRGDDPVQLANHYFSEQEQGSEDLSIFLVLAESMLRDALVFTNNRDELINEELSGVLRKGRLNFFEAEDTIACLNAIRRGVNENINLRHAMSELLIRMKRLLTA